MGSSIYSSNSTENEQADTSREVLENEIKDLCFVVKFDAFYDTFLSDGAQEPTAGDLKDCVDHLRKIKDLDCRYSEPSTNPQPGSGTGFLALKRAKKESELYKAQAKLLTAIGDYVRQRKGPSIDSSWPRAQDPFTASSLSLPDHILPSQPPSANPQPPAPSLHRRFVFCPSKPTKSVLGEGNPAKLKLNMAMAITKPDAEISYDRAFAQQPQFYWKDVMLPIEVRLDSTFTQGVASQVAAYARMIRVEQPDRNFVYALTISKNECRVWRWDASACYVSEALNIHTSPTEFVRLIWRLHTMSPEDFGFDNHFSNAGRVLAEEVGGIPTTLTIQGVTPTISRNPLSAKHDVHGGSEAQKGDVIERAEEGVEGEVYLLEEKLFQSPGLFGRNTLVWRARVLDKHGLCGATVVIKQSWPDVTRESEASYYTQANTIPQGIAHLRTYQELDDTREWRDRLSVVQPARDESNTSHLGDIRQSISTSASGQVTSHLHLLAPIHRRLLRMVFTGVGRPLSEAQDSEELLTALLDIVNAMERLYEMGILHSDISTGNILLNGEKDPALGNRGLIIDLGLAQRLPNAATSLPVATHNRRTGTLPFMARDLLNPDPNRIVMHELHHDLESIFWVLLYVCLKTSTLTKETEWWISRYIADLESSHSYLVYTSKASILLGSDFYQFSGRFSGLLPVVKKFALMCRRSLNGEDVPVRLSFESVKALLQNGLDELSRTPPISPPISPNRAREQTTTAIQPGTHVQANSIVGAKRQRGELE